MLNNKTILVKHFILPKKLLSAECKKYVNVQRTIMNVNNPKSEKLNIFVRKNTFLQSLPFLLHFLLI